MSRDDGDECVREAEVDADDEQIEPVLGRRLARPVALVGLMGAGKSAVGRRLASALGAPFTDADDEIEDAAGMSIPEIFAKYGEAHFRDGERRVIARLMSGDPLILATGGGAYMNEETRALLKRTAHTIWIRADLDVLAARCARRDDRPLLAGRDVRETLAALLAERGPVYAQADSVIDSGDGPHASVVASAIDALAALGSLVDAEVAS